MHALSATGVCRNYGTQQVLRDFSLTLEPGEFVALMGPSGSGKSTFLHLAAGLLTAEAGSIRIGEAEITQMSDAAVTKFRRRHVGVVFQAFNLLNEKTVRENILLPLKLDRGWAGLGGGGLGSARPTTGERFSTGERLEVLSERLGLKGLLDKKPEQLSGGEQQRVALARALIAEPEIVLADEPTGNLDTRAAKEVCAILKELNQLTKSAILVVTHDPQVAACATKVCFLKDDRIAATYPTEGRAERVSELYLETYR